MHCTEDELKEYISDLADKVEDIDETVLALGRAINSVSNLSILEKRGIHSFLEDIGKQITACKDLSADVKDFTLKENR